MEYNEKNDLEERDYRMRRWAVLIASILVVIVLFALLGYYIGRPLVSLASQPEKFRQWIDNCGIWGRLIFLGIQMLQVVVAMIPGEVIEIGSGYAFGAFEGTLLCIVGIVLGSSLIFLLTRKLGVKLVEAFISREKISEMKWINSSQKLNRIIFIIFFIPGTPKDLLTYFVGLTPISLRDFLIISTIARIPSLVSSTFGGHALGDKNYWLALSIFVITGIISSCGMWLYNHIAAKKRREKTEP